MSSIATSEIEPSQPDRLTFTLFLAAAAHAIVILGVSFAPILSEMRTPPALEVVLVQKTDTEKPEKADYLANAAQDGGGESDDNARPATPFASNQDFDTDGIAPTPMQAQAPDVPVPDSDQVLTTLLSEREENTQDPDAEMNPDIAKEAPILIEEDLAIAKLSAEIDMQMEQYAKRPKKKVLTAATHESAAAAYMHAWAEKVERVGNLNYPDLARRENLSGALLLIVGIYKDGNIESVEVQRSSGHQILDDAARRIVRLSAPFAALSGKLAEETDILYIVRTWDFQSDNSIRSY